jgi:DNA-binding LacI/PurR family transcriptional regulator
VEIAIFTANDQVAAGLLTEARKHGIRVPEDLAILGFDNFGSAYGIKKKHVSPLRDRDVQLWKFLMPLKFHDYQNDQVAAGLLTEARKHGIRVPEDLAILGFDNHEINLLALDLLME